MNNTFGTVIKLIVKNVIMLLILGGAILLGIKYYKAPDRSLVENPQLVEQMAMTDITAFLEDKELFLEYALCRPADNDSIFKKHLKPLLTFRGEGVRLYSTTYSVKVASLGGALSRMVRIKPEYISCEARVYSKIIDDGSDAGIVATGLVFSEPINNKAAANGLMQKIYSYSTDNRPMVIMLGIMFLFFWGSIVSIMNTRPRKPAYKY